MGELTLTSSQVQNLVEHLVTVFGAAGGSVIGAPFVADGSILEVGAHTTIGYDNESMDGWAAHPLQLRTDSDLVNQAQQESIRLDLSSYAGETVYFLAKPSQIGQRKVLQQAEAELVTDLLNRSQNGAKDASVLLGSVTIDAGGAIVSTDVSIRENRIDNIQEIIDTLNSTGVLDHGALLNLSNDDHTIYLKADGTRALIGNQSAGNNKITDLAAPTNPNDAARLTDLPAPGVTDHGSLDALSLLDDDHTQYLKADGLRPLSGNWGVGNFNITQVKEFELHSSGGEENIFHKGVFLMNDGGFDSITLNYGLIDASGEHHSMQLNPRDGTFEFGATTAGTALALDIDNLQLIGNNSGTLGRLNLASGLTADRTWTLPNQSGTVALTSQLISFPLQGPNGSGAAPSYSFSGNTATGMYRTGTGLSEKLHFGVNGQSDLEVTATGEILIGYGRIDHTAKGVGLRLTGDNGGGSDRTIELKAPQTGSFAANLVLTLPPTGGTVGQVLKTTGGVNASMYWDDDATGGGLSIGDSITGGTDNYVLYNNGGTVGNSAGLRVISDQTVEVGNQSGEPAIRLRGGATNDADIVFYQAGNPEMSIQFRNNHLGNGHAVLLSSGGGAVTVYDTAGHISLNRALTIDSQSDGAPVSAANTFRMRYNDTADRAEISVNGGAYVNMVSGISATGQSYTVTNDSTDRAYDANATTLDELADVVGTLISDLQSSGIIS